MARYLFLLFTIAFVLAGCDGAPTAVSNPITIPVSPTLNPEPVPPTTVETMQNVRDTAVPAQDALLLTAQLKGVDAPRTVAEPKLYQMGDVESFWYADLNSSRSVQTEAELVYHSQELSMWVEVGQHVDREALNAAAMQLEAEILPQTRAIFGEEWRPGVDGDARVHILHLENLGGAAAAYFSPKDQVVTAVNPYSNQREMLYVNLSQLRPGTPRYLATIAHEMQHLIQWHTDGNEEAWLGEGLAELASELNGFPAGRQATYAARPDIQLNNLSHDPEVISSHYAASTLFVQYLYDRFGQEFMQAVVRHPENGLAGINTVLAEFDNTLTVEGVFADWLAANYLTSVGRGEGVYQYSTLSIPELARLEYGRFPQSHSDSVSQFGADFIEINSAQPVTVLFTGTQQISLVNTTPYSGDFFYASLPADSSDVRLTRAVDLTGVDAATLSFWTWYEIEEGWDYGYVMVSTDDGRTWDLLKTESTATDNPHGNSFGEAYTGNSGGGSSAVWVQETADLTPYTSQEILLRFSAITDGAVTEAGFVVDDIAIPEIDYFDDAEVETGWHEEGFLRSTAVLPQKFLVQRILLSDDDVQVEQLLLDENQHGQWLFPMDNHYDRAILIVAGLTPVTRETAVYQYEISQ